MEPTDFDSTQISPRAYAELIKKVSGVIGPFLTPYHIKKITAAKNQAKLESVKTEIHANEMLAASTRRLEIESVLHEQKISKILQLAEPEIKESANPEDMDDEWLSRFFNECRHVSDSEMQTLWARILAGEANVPGSYSKRTVNFVSELSKKEAQTFTKLCGFCVLRAPDRDEPLVLSYRNSVYTSQVEYKDLMHLDNIGLIDFDASGFSIRDVTPGKFRLYYFGKPIHVDIPEHINDFQTGMVRLTQIGRELQRIAGAQPVDGFLTYLTKKLKNYRLTILNSQRCEIQFIDYEDLE